MDYDVIIRGGTVIDGTGAPRRRADVGIRGQRVAAIGDLSASSAGSTIDAAGRIVAPGFIGVHTHVDAQVFWDTTVSPSPLHGVTTVIGGNCGFSVAPLGKNPEDGHYLMRMLSRVEGMPLHSLEIGVPWDWDGDSTIDADPVRVDINDGDGFFWTLRDHDDWSAIRLGAVDDSDGAVPNALVDDVVTEQPVPEPYR